MHIGSNVHVDRSWGLVIVHRQWGCVDRRSNRSKVEEKLTGSVVRWARRDWSGTKLAFASQWWIGVCFVSMLYLDRRLLRCGGSAFGTLADWRLVHWSAFGSQVWLAFGSFSLSLATFVCWVCFVVFCCVLFAECVSLFCTCYENRLKIKRLCKMIFGSTSVNFGQTEIIFRKIYFL